MRVVDTNSLLPVGTLLRDTYVIDGYLASGGFGNTYVVHHKVFEERKAIKELFLRGMMCREEDLVTVGVVNPNETAQVSEYMEGFMDEARRMHKLNSRNIVKVYDIFKENNTAYYVMDYIDGNTLSEILKERNASLSNDEVKGILFQMLDALDDIHRKGLWHLDIKPSNIMLDGDGNAILIDFGTSRQIDINTGAQVTSAIPAYTPGYSPSEQLDYNFKMIGSWTDLYALGATIYNLLTNQNPPMVSDISNYGIKAFHFPEGTDEKLKELTIWMMNPHINTRPSKVSDVRNFLKNVDKVLQKPQGRTPKVDKSNRLETEEKETVYLTMLYSQPTEISKRPETSTRKWILISLFAFVAAMATSLGVIYFLKSGNNASKLTAKNQDTPAGSDTVMVENKEITIEEDGKKVTYTYTGPTIDGRPNGQGVAIYSKNDVETRYEGPFVDGVREGKHGKLTYTQGKLKGDVYEGDFHNGIFEGECVYTESSSGMVFKGTAKDGGWYNGEWSKDNKVEYKIVEGREVAP